MLFLKLELLYFSFSELELLGQLLYQRFLELATCAHFLPAF